MVLDSIRRIVRSLRVSSKIVEKGFGVSGAQLFVLQKIHSLGALSINDLAAATLTDQSSVSVVVARLAKDGLLQRKTSKEDARRAEVSLTRKGRSLLEETPETSQERLIHAVSALPAGERAALNRILHDLISLAQLQDEKPAMFFEDEEPASKKLTQLRSKKSGRRKTRRD